MGTLYALVLTITMANGDYQEGTLGVYGSQQLCEAAASEQTSVTECKPVEKNIHADEATEQPAQF